MTKNKSILILPRPTTVSSGETVVLINKGPWRPVLVLGENQVPKNIKKTTLNHATGGTGDSNNINYFYVLGYHTMIIDYVCLDRLRVFDTMKCKEFLEKQESLKKRHYQRAAIRQALYFKNEFQQQFKEMIEYEWSCRNNRLSSERQEMYKVYKQQKAKKFKQRQEFEQFLDQIQIVDTWLVIRLKPFFAPLDKGEEPVAIILFIEQYVSHYLAI
ncbi:hypothetical protein BDA99DRAFT_573419 [Phascolomyces articulosus]|uniref:Uncharacterized protein n=1 Tax=Phascolomyces articulosus TaxID=60185 RepID=A0AAD5JX46_9FUNG|nr:hypothetical protein BDA99DRAFT_573419 [Phascolomyces articulosus]